MLKFEMNKGGRDGNACCYRIKVKMEGCNKVHGY